MSMGVYMCVGGLGGANSKQTLYIGLLELAALHGDIWMMSS